MYFSDLENATITKQDKRDNIVTKENIRKLDGWLARIPSRDKHNLNYMKFAREEKLDFFTAFCLFMEAEELGVLNSLYRVKVESSVVNYDDYENIPKGVSDSNIELVFTLSAFPSEHPAQTPIEWP